MNKPQKSNGNNGKTASIAATSISRTVSKSMYSGPVPDPETLAQFEAIQPGFAERLMAMAEKEQTNRHQSELEERNNERYIVESIDRQHLRDSSAFKRGQNCALISVITIVGLCCLAFLLGYADQAKWIAICVIVSLAGVFVVKKIVFPSFSGGKEEKEEKEEK